MMDYETYQEICYGIHTIEEPDEINLMDDPYWEDQASVEEHLDHEAYLAEMIGSYIGMEVRL